MTFAIRLSSFVVRTSACASILLLAGASGCSAAGDRPDADHAAYLETEIGTCDHVLEAGDLSNPHIAPVSAELGARQYSAPLEHVVTVSSALPEANQAAAIAALDNVETITGGNVRFDIRIGETSCRDEWAVHAAPQGQCALVSRGGGWVVGWTFSAPHRPLSVVVRSTKAEGGTPSALETYTLVLHEVLAHHMGVGHSAGITHADLGEQITNPTFSERQANKLAARWNWPTWEMAPGAYAYESP